MIEQRDRAKQFRNALILKPGFDFSMLKAHCDRIIYATDGFTTDLEPLQKQLQEAFKEFDPKQDVLIPVGSTVSCVLAGINLSQLLKDCDFEGDEPNFIMGIYLDQEYRFFRVYPSGEDGYEIITR